VALSGPWWRRSETLFCSLCNCNIAASDESIDSGHDVVDSDQEEIGSKRVKYVGASI